ncbi:hypothetical protein FB45DRAFT_928069 [Roridomyces roridus]|uniref:Uncharacterized protein n=1 Tax=Roridomyces roridus TaxID=1738132 RepID=A0AAD7BH14_9AGAR|nr:hypothetical protein FB45DRAFT_928069 [Roridomyces roridus]
MASLIQSLPTEVDDAGFVIPTFDISVLNSLELDLEHQLSAVMNGFFEGEFASLRDLEPISTTTTLLGPDRCGSGQLGSSANETAESSGELLVVGKNIKVQTNEPVQSDGPIVGTTRSGVLIPDLPEAVSRPPVPAPSSRDAAVITRSTKLPSFSAPASEEPTIRAGTQRAEEPTVVRTTSAGAVSVPISVKHASQGPADLNVEYTPPSRHNLDAAVPSILYPQPPVSFSVMDSIDQDVEMSFSGVDTPQTFPEFQYQVPSVSNNGTPFVSGPPNLYPTSEPVYSLSQQASAHLQLPERQPSIFELIQTEHEVPLVTVNPSSFIISPAIVPDHLWREERLRISERNSNMEVPPRRARSSAPYFIRTPLQHVRRVSRPRKSAVSPPVFPPFDHAFTCSGRETRQDSFEVDQEPPERPASPAASLSTDSERSFSSASSTFSYERRLSSPPPFSKRRCFQVEPVASSGSLGSALRFVAKRLLW